MIRYLCSVSLPKSYPPAMEYTIVEFVMVFSAQWDKIIKLVATTSTKAKPMVAVHRGPSKAYAARKGRDKTPVIRRV